MPRFMLYRYAEKNYPSDFGAVLALNLSFWPARPDHMVLAEPLGEWEGVTAGDAVCEWLRATNNMVLAISVNSKSPAYHAYIVGYSYSSRDQAVSSTKQTGDSHV